MDFITNRIEETYPGKSGGFGCRESVDSFGINVYIGETSNGNRKRMTPRAGPGQALKSSYHQSSNKINNIPDITKIVNKLTQHAAEVSVSMDPLTDICFTKFFGRENNIDHQRHCNVSVLTQ